MRQIANKYRTGFVYLVLTIITLVVFWQVHNFDFTNYDDNRYVTENPHITTGLSWHNVLWVFTNEHVGNWHPMTGLSHILDCQLFGLNPSWHHLVNLLFHIANTLLLFTIFRKMTGALWQSAFVTALFALHTLHVESVAWISERKDVLSTFFLILTITAYYRYVKNPKAGNYILTLILFVLGLMSKPMLVTLPFVLLLLDYWPLNRLTFNSSGQIYTLILEKIPFFILSAVSSIITFLVQQSAGAITRSEVIPLTMRIANAVISYMRYIGKMVWPANLAMFYPHQQNKMGAWILFAAVFILLLITIIVIRMGKQWKYLPFSWFWYIGTLVPVIGLVQVGSQSMADRYTYIPLIGLFIIVAWGANDLLAGYRYRKIVLSVSSVVIISVLSVCTFLQTGYWKNSTTLYNRALKVTTGNYIVHNNLGKTLFDQNRFEEALNHFQDALKIRPNYPYALINFGFVYNKLHPQDDIEACIRAIKIKPGFVEAYSYLGVAYERTDRYQKEVKGYKSAIEIKPDNVETYNNLGKAYWKVGHWEDAIKMYEKAIEIRPDFSESYNNLGILYGSIGQYSEAIEMFKRTMKVDPNNIDAYNNLGTTYNRLGKLQDAIEVFNQAIKIQPQDPRAYYGLGLVYIKAGEINLAKKQYEILKTIDSEQAEQLLGLIQKYSSQK